MRYLKTDLQQLEAYYGKVEKPDKGEKGLIVSHGAKIVVKEGGQISNIIWSFAGYC